jgi:hypothetical protein
MFGSILEILLTAGWLIKQGLFEAFIQELRG